MTIVIEDVQLERLAQQIAAAEWNSEATSAALALLNQEPKRENIVAALEARTACRISLSDPG